MLPALVQAWTHVVGGQVADDDLDLAACSLLIAELSRPGLDTATYLRRLDDLAAGSRAAARAGEGELDAVLRHLFVELGFRGNAGEYYDPRNSCLDQVLDRRLGIPITLSVVVLEVGWRLGLDVAGVGFPGHFLVRGRERGEERMIDAFAGGVTLDRAELEQLLKKALGPRAALRPEHVRPFGKREILARILNNLRAIYRLADDAVRTAEVVELLAVLARTAPPRGASN
jgi:regulator of sirC expression with transglutaminase-like and TPR domain